jgi:hypothetical protein
MLPAFGDFVFKALVSKLLLLVMPNGPFNPKLSQNRVPIHTGLLDLAAGREVAVLAQAQDLVVILLLRKNGDGIIRLLPRLPSARCPVRLDK